MFNGEQALCLTRIDYRTCRIGVVWTDGPGEFLAIVCPQYRHCDASFTPVKPFTLAGARNGTVETKCPRAGPA
jgi:hypothetical protein